MFNTQQPTSFCSYLFLDQILVLEKPVASMAEDVEFNANTVMGVMWILLCIDEIVLHFPN